MTNTVFPFFLTSLQRTYARSFTEHRSLNRPLPLKPFIFLPFLPNRVAKVTNFFPLNQTEKQLFFKPHSISLHLQLTHFPNSQHRSRRLGVQISAFCFSPQAALKKKNRKKGNKLIMKMKKCEFRNSTLNGSGVREEIRWLTYPPTHSPKDLSRTPGLNLNYALEILRVPKMRQNQPFHLTFIPIPTKSK